MSRSTLLTPAEQHDAVFEELAETLNLEPPEVAHCFPYVEPAEMVIKLKEINVILAEKEPKICCFPKFWAPAQTLANLKPSDYDSITKLAAAYEMNINRTTSVSEAKELFTQKLRALKAGEVKFTGIRYSQLR